MQEPDKKTRKKEKEPEHENQSGGPWWCASHGSSSEEVETLQFPHITAEVGGILLLLCGLI